MTSPTNMPTLTLGLRTFSRKPATAWTDLCDYARWADEAGIDRLVVSDHVVLGETLDAHHAAGGGQFPTGPDGAWLEAMTVLTYLAALTSRVRLAPAVLIAPLRRPVVLAKAVATLDVLSGGRVDLGVGIGWQHQEYEAAGLRFSERGDLLDDTLAVCRAMWTESPVTVTTRSVSFTGIWSYPHPVQPGGPPIWLSGRLHQRTVERILTYGAGWIPWGEYRADIALAVRSLHRVLEDHGRDPASVAIRHDIPVVTDQGGSNVEATMQRVPALLELGVADFRLLTGPNGLGGDARQTLGELVKAFREIAGRTD